MEQGNIKENKIKSDVEETKIEVSNEENTNIEIQNLISDENSVKESSAKVILANILDQALILAGSAILLLISDLVLRVFGYMFVRETGALVLAGGIIYFILNCIYSPIMECSKLKNTIGKKILNKN